MPKTLRFNLTYLPLAQALSLPVVVCHRVHFDRLGGTVRVPAGARMGSIRLGFGEVGIFDRQRRRSVWRVEGNVVFQGSARLGHGSRISVVAGGVLTFGDGFVISAESAIDCRKEVTFGKDVLLSWDVQVMDSDWHYITDQEGTVLNPDSAILVGDHVWIGSRVLLMKGARIARDSVVAAGSVVTRGTYHANVVLAGIPAREISQGITWSLDEPQPSLG
jgi:acetyltransferase-like isoleucine patch superfamily enzyme